MNDHVLIPKAMLVLIQNCLKRDVDERGTRKDILALLNESVIAPEEILTASGNPLLSMQNGN